MKTTTSNNRYIVAVLCLLFFSGIKAQHRNEPNRGDRIESLRVAFISQELNLTPAEAQKFWPVYNQYRDEMEALRKNYRMGEVAISADQQLEFEQKKLDIKKKYKAEFDAAVGKEKCNQLYGIEEKFRQKMKELRDQRQQGPPPGERPGMRGGFGPR